MYSILSVTLINLTSLRGGVTIGGGQNLKFYLGTKNLKLVFFFHTRISVHERDLS